MRKTTLLLAAVCLVLAVPASAANLVLINLDGPGTGLNDPTPATPVGGNPGTTIGAQRVNVYNLATLIWGSVLDSNATIFVGATFQPLSCAPTGGVLGAAGPTFVFRDFPGAGVVPSTWYTGAEADALAGFDLAPGNIDIISFFNSDIDDDDPNCLTGRSWYYGFDNDEGIDFDFLTVVLHEIAHGLGNLELVSEATGELFLGFPDIYSRFMLDSTTGLFWDQMTDAERLASQVNSDNLVWAGANVSAAAPGLLGPRPSVKILNPKSIEGSYEAQAASFGPPLNSGGGTTGKMVLADDGTGAPNDACEPIQNKLNGKIAVVDRGACSFVSKVLNAQAAGAKGVIVVNNLPSGRAPMGGSSPDVVIPSVGVSMADGDAIKAVLPGNSVSKLILDTAFQAGTQNGLVRLYAPNPVQPGSSKSHWDQSATPNLLMEPAINSDLESATNLDLTPFLFMDIGWSLLP